VGDGVTAGVDLAGLPAEHRLVPDPVEAEGYVECAVEAPTDDEGDITVVSPDHGPERERMTEQLRATLADDESDLALADLVSLDE
jgi:hypothetical protein